MRTLPLFTKHWRLLLAGLVACLFCTAEASGQCTACVADPTCSSDNGFPTICPATLPAATVGISYEETITFFLPAQVVDPGSGVTADLNSVTITSITGVPLGMQVELDDDDAVYYPSDGQTLGCASICGVPLLAGVYDMVINISAVASAFGIEQVVTDSFPYALLVEAGEGGTATFSYSPPSGCDSLVADFEASLAGNANQITAYAWNFGNGQQAQDAVVNGVIFASADTFNVSLTTTISDQVLTEVVLSSTAGGGWDDGWSPSPDPYFVLSDGSGNSVFTSSTADETYSNTWSGLNIVLANPPYSVTFYDEDLFPDDDYLGAMSFTPNGPGTLDLNADPSYGSLTIGLQTAVSANDTAQVVVNASPGVLIAWNASGDTLIASGASDDDLIAYDWWWGDSLMAAGADSVFVPQANGWYSVTGTNATGCSSTSDSVLYCAPEAGFTLNLSLGDWPETVAAEVPGDPSLWTFVWTFNGAASDTLVGVASWPTDASGWYAAEAWDTYGCPWLADSVLVCWPLNAPVITEDADGWLSVTPSYAQYQWWVLGEPIPGATDSVYQTTGPGAYAVSVTDFADCPGVISEDWVVVEVAEQAQAEAAKLQWMVYPNPAAQWLALDLPDGVKVCQLEVFNLNGSRLLSTVVADEQRMDVGDWPPGVYLLKARAGEQWLPTLRVIKQ